MVVLEIDIQRVSPDQPKADAIVPGHPHGPSPRLAVQTVEPVACNVHILGLRRHVQRLQVRTHFRTYSAPIRRVVR